MIYGLSTIDMKSIYFHVIYNNLRLYKIFESNIDKFDNIYVGG